MERNERYRGEKPDWKQVELRFITNDGARVATLLAGGVNLIENLPAQLFDRVKQAGGFEISPARRCVRSTLNSMSEVKRRRL